MCSHLNDICDKGIVRNRHRLDLVSIKMTVAEHNSGSTFGLPVVPEDQQRRAILDFPPPFRNDIC